MKKKLDFQKASEEELRKAQLRTAIPTIDHLKRWLAHTGRKYVIFNGADLLDALEDLPEAPETFQQIVGVYTSHRAAIPTGDVCRVEVAGKMVDAPVYKDDRLTTEELDEVIRQLTREMYDRNPNWKL